MSRSADKVSRTVKEGHGRVSEYREDVPNHPDFANSAFGNHSGAYWTAVVKDPMIVLEDQFAFAQRGYLIVCVMPYFHRSSAHSQYLRNHENITCPQNVLSCCSM